LPVDLNYRYDVSALSDADRRSNRGDDAERKRGGGRRGIDPRFHRLDICGMTAA
jgi:hypothetical protein